MKRPKTSNGWWFHTKFRRFKTNIVVPSVGIICVRFIYVLKVLRDSAFAWKGAYLWLVLVPVPRGHDSFSVLIRIESEGFARLQKGVFHLLHFGFLIADLTFCLRRYNIHYTSSFCFYLYYLFIYCINTKITQYMSYKICKYNKRWFLPDKHDTDFQYPHRTNIHTRNILISSSINGSNQRCVCSAKFRLALDGFLKIFGSTVGLQSSWRF